jgi:glycosyltransferase involved in cell wall biosynthesis
MRHYPAFIPPLKLLQNKKIVVTSLDLCPLTFQKKKCSFIYAKMLKLLNLADRIIAISNSVKNDLIKFANLPEEKIDVIYLGVDKKIFHPIDSKNLNKIVSNDFSRKKMILHVGVDNKRKNIKNLLLAFYKLSKKYKDVELIRVGTPSKESLQLIKILNLQNKVKYLQNCSDTDLNKLYNLCDLFIFPSFCEGFGLPLVEAMACGAPIITSKNSSMPEVVGDAAILIDPKNINDIFRAMDQILSDDSLKEELKRKAYKRSKLFSWEKTFNQTIKVYHSIEKK